MDSSDSEDPSQVHATDGGADSSDVGDEYQSKAEMFIDQHGDKIHPMLAADDAYTKQRPTAPLAKNLKKSTQQAAEQFVEVMNAYQASIKYPELQAIDLRGANSWDDVIQAVNDAHQKYLQAGQKWPRKMGRFMTTNADVSGPLLRLIPNGTLTSVLYGGLRMAASRVGALRETGLKSLSRIPHVIVQAGGLVTNFPDDLVLHEQAEKVYLAALATIEGTMARIQQTSFGKLTRSVILGPSYGRPLKEKIQALEEALDMLQDRIQILSDMTIVKTEHTIENVEATVNKVEKVGDSTLVHVRDLKTDLRGLSSTTNDNNQRLSSVTDGMKVLTEAQAEAAVELRNLQDLQQARNEAREALRKVLEEKSKTADWMRRTNRHIHRLQSQVKLLEQAAIGLTKDDLLDILDVNPTLPGSDLRRIIRACESTELAASQAAHSIIAGKMFSEWYSANASVSLFIEGQSSMAVSGRNTALSLTCCRLVEALRDMEPAAAIHYFCGAHTSSKDMVHGPRGMMRSLLCQVLRIFPVDLDSMFSRRSRQQLESFDLRALCETFWKLVKRLPATAVLICLIDGVSFFESREWAQDCHYAINELRELVDEDEGRAVFKLLVTSPVRSKYIGKVFPTDCYLQVSGDNSTSRGGPTPREMNMAIRRPTRVPNDTLVRSLRAKHNASNMIEDSSDDSSGSDRRSDSTSKASGYQ